MRLPLSSDVVSRDGASNKDERLTNALLEKDEDVTLTVVRPGLVTTATASGNGNGLVRFNDKLISVYGTTLGGNISSNEVTENSMGDSNLTPMSVDYLNGEYLITAYSGLSDMIEQYVGDGISSFSFVDYGMTDLSFMDSVTTTFTANRYLIATSTEIYRTSLSGSTSFTMVYSTTGSIWSVNYATSKVVALIRDATVSQKGRIAHSTNGASGTWTEVDLPANFYPSGVVFGDGTWLIVGTSAPSMTTPLAYRTSDFITFTPVTITGDAMSGGFIHMETVGGIYIAQGSDGINYRIYTSRDGADWSLAGSEFVGASRLKKIGNYVYAYADSFNITPYNGVSGYFRTLDGVVWEFAADDTLVDGTFEALTVNGTDAILIPMTSGLDTWWNTTVPAWNIPTIGTVESGFYDFAQSPL